MGTVYGAQVLFLCDRAPLSGLVKHLEEEQSTEIIVEEELLFFRGENDLVAQFSTLKKLTKGKRKKYWFVLCVDALHPVAILTWQPSQFN